MRPGPQVHLPGPTPAVDMLRVNLWTMSHIIIFHDDGHISNSYVVDLLFY
jgi:hypothetical protein